MGIMGPSVRTTPQGSSSQLAHGTLRAVCDKDSGVYEPMEDGLEEANPGHLGPRRQKTAQKLESAETGAAAQQSGY